MSKKINIGAFSTLISIFFFWGFVAASNDILIPVFKKALDLSQFESQLISLAFYIAYTVTALPMAAVLKRTGYKNGLVLGLIVMAVEI